MYFRQQKRMQGNIVSFNITAIIDIVFLLIIFFALVCRFIEAENFTVNVPDACHAARSNPRPGDAVTTLSVMKTDQKTEFAVGSEKIVTSDKLQLVARLAELINSSFETSSTDRRIITLRIDRDVCYASAQYALAAVAESAATDVQLAALKDENKPLK